MGRVNGSVEHAVIVGGSIAGLRAAEAARQVGFAGRLTIVGAEAHPPYDRRLLSKGFLTGQIPLAATALPRPADLDAAWRLETAASRLDRAARRVRLSDGGTLSYDRLVVATGARPQPWPNPREGALRGLHVLRERDDALALREALAARPNRVVVVGGGLVGCEVAHMARRLGLPVTLVERGAAPMARTLGPLLGEVIGARLEAAGVELRLARQVRRLESSDHHQILRVMLNDSEAIDAELVVATLGSIRNTDWLDGSGLRADEHGLACDGHGRALTLAGPPDPAILAAGDVALLPHPLFGRLLNPDHWSLAEAHAAFVGARLADPESTAPFTVLPSFHSQQGDLDLAAVGLVEGADALVFAEGEPATGRFLVVFGRAGTCVAAVAFDMGDALPPYADAIAQRAPFPPVRPGRRLPTVLPLGLA